MMVKLEEIVQITCNPTYYVFYEGYYTPYLYSKTNPWASGSANASIMYNYDTNTFFPYSLTTRMLDTYMMPSARTLPVLSLEIITSDDTVQYDLTDYIETMKYIQSDNSPVPTIAQIVATWSLVSHIVLDSKRFSVRYINDYGDTVLTGLDDMSDLTDIPDNVSSDEEVDEVVEQEVVEQEVPAMEEVVDALLTLAEPEAPKLVQCKCHSWPGEFHAAIDEFNKAWPECESRVEQTLPTIRGILASESATGVPTDDATMVETPTVEGSAHDVEGSAHDVEGTSVERISG
jgi:hypothetical protein